jgi:hypothetical protein
MNQHLIFNEKIKSYDLNNILEKNNKRRLKHLKKRILKNTKG